MNKEDLLLNINKLHTTKMGLERIEKNINIERKNIIDYCKKTVIDKNCKIDRKGKNWYCELNNIIITINSNSYTIITAHIKK